MFCNKAFTALIVSLLLFDVTSAFTTTGCKIRVNLLDTDQPIVLNEHKQFVYPENLEGTISIKKNDHIFLMCGMFTKPSENNVIKLNCIGNDKFDTPVDSYKCTNYTKSKLNIEKDKPCKNNEGYKISIGFQGKDSSRNIYFINLITVCYDSNEKVPFYVIEELTQSIRNQPKKNSDTDRVQWIGYEIKGSILDSMYENQRRTINKLLDLEDDSSTYIYNKDSKSNKKKQQVNEEEEKKRLSRGHLAAKADFMYGFQQQATYHYLNSAPQWQLINEGNWKEIEQSVRSLAAKKRLTVYTGVYGITKLPNKESNNDTELFLRATKSETKGNLVYLFAVPAVFWKVVHDVDNKQAIVLLTINNPYIDSEEKAKEYIYCTDITNSQKINWLLQKPKSYTKGYSYACRYEDFEQNLKFGLGLDASGGLLLFK